MSCAVTYGEVCAIVIDERGGGWSAGGCISYGLVIRIGTGALMRKRGVGVESGCRDDVRMDLKRVDGMSLAEDAYL